MHKILGISHVMIGLLNNIYIKKSQPFMFFSEGEVRPLSMKNKKSFLLQPLC